MAIVIDPIQLSEYHANITKRLANVSGTVKPNSSGLRRPTRTLCKFPAYIVNRRGHDPRKNPARQRLDREAEIVVGGPRRLLMIDSDSDRTEAIHQIASILAGAFLRLRFPASPQNEVDCSETKSESCGGRLTL
jgi:hypothetical protein